MSHLQGLFNQCEMVNGTWVFKILKNHTLGLASKIEGFSRVSLENPSKGKAFRGLSLEIRGFQGNP